MTLYKIHVVEHIWERQKHVMFLSVLYAYTRRSCNTTCYHDFSSGLSCTALNRKPTETVMITLESKTKLIFCLFSGFIVFCMFVLTWYTVHPLVCYFGFVSNICLGLYSHFIFCILCLPLKGG